MAIKKLTILHSNDIHGDFLSKQGEDGLATGGVAMLSGYIEQCRKTNDTLYLFAGDMFQGSLIDRDYKGWSTCQIMKMIDPDAMILGNHEVDHGLQNLYHARTYYELPIITSNLMLDDSGYTIFYPYTIIPGDGYKVLVLGVTTDMILMRTEKEPLLNHIKYIEPALAIKNILQNVPADAFDLTIVLSHLGRGEDHNLAKSLPKGSVDLIIGGHTHDNMDEPDFENGIPIIQLANNTNNVGRFDLKIDTEKHCLAQPITKKSWKKISINEKNCPVNEELQCFVWILEEQVNEKYSRVISQLDHSIETDGNRFVESQIGDLFADALRNKLNIKIVAIGSGSLRQNAFDQTVTLGNLRSMYSFDESLFHITLTGEQLKTAMTTILRTASSKQKGDHGEYYQLSDGCQFIFNVKEDCLTTATYNGSEIDNDALYSVGIEGIHLNHIEEYWGLRMEDVLANGEKECISKDIFETLSKYFKNKKTNKVIIAVPELQRRTGFTDKEEA